MPAGAEASSGTSAAASSAAESHGSGSAPERNDTASVLMPSWPAVSAAPTVPEWSTERPTLTPWLIPDTTRSGRGPMAPSAPAMTESAGDAARPKAGTCSAPRIVARW